MSAFPPPNVYFNGIIYDSDYFTQSSSSGLSVAQANALYLRKTVTDTATALETFNSGIKTNTITPLTSSGTLAIGDTSTNVININNSTSRTGAIFIGSGDTSQGVIRIGGGNGSLNTIQIMNGTYASGQTAGDVNIASGAFASGALGGTVNIGRNTRTFIYIGGSNNTTSIFSGTINIGTSTSQNYIYNIESPSASTNIDLYSLLSGANLTLCNGQGTGYLSLGSGTGRSGGVSIMTNGNAPGSNELLLGDSTKTIRLRGTLTLNADVNNNITIGQSGGTNIIILNRPFTVGYSYPIGAGLIGSYTQNSTITTTTLNAVGQAVGSISVTSAGLYCITVNGQFSTSALGQLYCTLTTPATDPLLFTNNIGYTTLIPTATAYGGWGNTFYCNPTGSATYTFAVAGISGTYTVSVFSIKAIRIA